jgi:hypothetical protein
MTIKAGKKADAKPTPIVPQVWAIVWYLNSDRIADPEGMTLVGPEEWLDHSRLFPTEEMAEQAALNILSDANGGCVECLLLILFGHIAFLRCERLE